jgi:uncharacterized protein YbjT (DUF2867 family)
VVAGDYLDLDAMRTAVEGVRRAYFVYPIRPGKGQVMKVAGSIALVTGANRGLGLAFARALLEKGAATVYAAARKPEAVTHYDRSDCDHNQRRSR